jgi:hypothetical protein
MKFRQALAGLTLLLPVATVGDSVNEWGIDGVFASDTSRRRLQEPACTGVDEDSVPCGNNDEAKLEVCHYSNNETLCVAENDAIGHISNTDGHEYDYCGPCIDIPIFAFDFYQQVFGEPSLDENGEPVFPLFEIQGWTSTPQTGAYMVQTLDGQSKIVQAIEIVTSSELNAETTLVYGTIDGVGFLGLVPTFSVTSLIIMQILPTTAMGGNLQPGSCKRRRREVHGESMTKWLPRLVILWLSGESMTKWLPPLVIPWLNGASMTKWYRWAVVAIVQREKSSTSLVRFKPHHDPLLVATTF